MSSTDTSACYHHRVARVTSRASSNDTPCGNQHFREIPTPDFVRTLRQYPILDSMLDSYIHYKIRRGYFAEMLVPTWMTHLRDIGMLSSSCGSCEFEWHMCMLSSSCGVTLDVGRPNQPFQISRRRLVPFFRQSPFRTFRQKLQPQIHLEMFVEMLAPMGEIVEKKGTNRRRLMTNVDKNTDKNNEQ